MLPRALCLRPSFLSKPQKPSPSSFGFHPMMRPKNFQSCSMMRKTFSTGPSNQNLNPDQAILRPVKRAANPERISSADLISLNDYEKNRKQYLAWKMEDKKIRRIPVGPNCTAIFENYDSIWIHVHEMLRIERATSQEQVQDELVAYNPLLPQGDSIVATVMFEIPNRSRRIEFLNSVGDIDEHIFLTIRAASKQFDVKGHPLIESEARTAKGQKASATHFMSFRLSEEQKRAFTEDAQVQLQIRHENYNHSAGLSKALVSSLRSDLK